MTTLVVSDLHLGTRTEVDVLRAPAARDALCGALADVDRLVLLGDTLELRYGPLHEVLARSAPFFRAVGEAMAGREVVLLPGNHDHALGVPALARRRRDGAAPPLALEQELEVTADEPLGRIRGLLGDAELSVRYPAVRLREDVWATHGHYLDPHFTIPTFERLAASVMRRVSGPLPEGSGAAGPDDYERMLAPAYAWLTAIAEHAPAPETAEAKLSPATRAWLRLTAGAGRRPVSTKLLRTVFGGLVGVLNRAGAGPLRADVSGEELRRAGLRGIGLALANLGVEAEHVVFGHTHRSGPWPADPESEWRTPTGSRLWNSGCWLLEAHFAGGAPGKSPYWPGRAVRIGETGPPEPVALLDELAPEELRAGRG